MASEQDCDDATPIEELIAQLASDDYETRAAAASMLAQKNATQAIGPMIDALHKPDPEGYVEQSLGNIGSPVVEPLLQLLSHPDKAMREKVVSALSLTHDQRVILPLIQVLAYDADQYDVANVALIGLARNRRLALAPLLSALGDVDSVMRQHAALALGHMYNPEAVEPLLGALADPVPEVRYSAIGALEQIGDDRAIQGLERALKDRSQTAWGEFIADVAERAIRYLRANPKGVRH